MSNLEVDQRYHAFDLNSISGYTQFPLLRFRDTYRSVDINFLVFGEGLHLRRRELGKEFGEDILGREFTQKAITGQLLQRI